MTGVNTTLVADKLDGDKTGSLSLRRSQDFHAIQQRLLTPFGLVAQRTSNVTLPPKLDCKDLDIILKGWT